MALVQVMTDFVGSPSRVPVPQFGFLREGSSSLLPCWRQAGYSGAGLKGERRGSSRGSVHSLDLMSLLSAVELIPVLCAHRPQVWHTSGRGLTEPALWSLQLPESACLSV